MKRSEIRENVLKLIYLDDFHDKEELNTQFSLYFDGKDGFTDKDKTYIIDKANKILDNKETIDQEIESVSNKWKVDRMDKVDKAILRLAYYEIKMDEEIPDKVAVNEAVELSKKYSSDASPKFINGILSNFVAE
ncbi:MAG TPA: transcription antitermination factor NusB [Eubacterium sp.]|nr:transcription antitermination factor NusB [Eubacterium sp.]